MVTKKRDVEVNASAYRRLQFSARIGRRRVGRFAAARVVPRKRIVGRAAATAAALPFQEALRVDLRAKKKKNITGPFQQDPSFPLDRLRQSVPHSKSFHCRPISVLRRHRIGIGMNRLYHQLEAIGNCNNEQCDHFHLEGRTDLFFLVWFYFTNGSSLFCCQYKVRLNSYHEENLIKQQPTLLSTTVGAMGAAEAAAIGADGGVILVSNRL